MEHSKIDPNWYFPDLAYSFNVSTESWRAKFVSYDSMSILLRKNNASGMLEFINSELNDTEADWKILFSHYPCYSAGKYSGSRITRNQVLPIRNADWRR